MSTSSNTLRIRLTLDLRRDQEGSFSPGPLFHRWLPNGEEDEIFLFQCEGGSDLRVWFNRCGFVDGAFIRFSANKSEVDPDVMTRQGLLDAGPLHAELRNIDVTEEELEALRITDFRHGRTELQPAYEALGSRVSRLIGPYLNSFTKRLTINQGQYWLREWPQYNAREHSTLGSYFSMCSAKWKSEGDEKWTRFLPSPLVIHVTAGGRTRYEEFLDSDDWVRLGTTVNPNEEPHHAAACIALANEHLGEDRLRQALIECVTAFEVAFAARIRQQSTSGSSVRQKLTSLEKNLSNKARVMCIAGFVESLSASTIESAIEAIDERNQLVHDGGEPTDLIKTKKRVEAMLTVCQSLLVGQVARLPKRQSAGCVSMPVERWQEESFQE